MTTPKLPEPVDLTYRNYSTDQVKEILEIVLNSYSPDDTAMDYLDKIIALKEQL